MKNNQINLHPTINGDLKYINGISLTPRQIDIIACFLAEQKSKSIALFLSITLKTVETHTHSIMQKLGCSSRDEVITSIKKSGKSFLFQNHYQTLLIQSLFEKYLREISTLIGKKELKCYLDFYPKTTEFDSFKSTLQRDFKIAHITLSRKHSNSLPVITILLGKTPSFNNEQNLSITNYVTFESSETYYFSVFDILKKILHYKGIEPIYEEFKKQYDSLQKNFNSSLPISSLTKQFSQKIVTFKNPKIIFSFLGVIIVIIFFIFYVKNSDQEKIYARSSLVIPTENSFLTRQIFIDEIKIKLNQRKNIERIPIIGIIGTGGSGKTTLARSYTGDLDTPIVWEVNATTKKCLFSSFNNLSYILAQTKEQRDSLNFIQNIKNPEEKEKQILAFIKKILKKINHWVFIYDNVENFSEIKKYLPQDSKTWGNGKVIITTRDGNIKNTGYIAAENIIEIKELSQEEALTLFSKILYNDESHKLNSSQKKKTLEFLQNIPPFPLDVSVAAYYIKNEHLTYDQYIERMTQHHKGLEIVQESLLREISDYTKTRSKIIISSLEKSIRINPEFKELLFLICLLDPQNIPKELLEFYNPKTSIDRFLHDLRGVGLIKSESIEENLHTDSHQATFSLHFSTQSISLEFLKNTLTEEEKSSFIKKILNAIKSYYDLYSSSNDKKMIIVTPHIKALIKNLKEIHFFLPSDKKSSLKSLKEILSFPGAKRPPEAI